MSSFPDMPGFTLCSSSYAMDIVGRLEPGSSQGWSSCRHMMGAKTVAIIGQTPAQARCVDRSLPAPRMVIFGLKSVGTSHVNSLSS